MIVKAKEPPIDPEEESGGEDEGSEEMPSQQEQEPPPIDARAYDDMSGFVTASRIEVPGVIVDEYTGKTWPVPTGTLLDDIKPHHSPYDIKKDPRFTYQAVCVKGPGGNESSDYESQGWVKVTRKEMGYPDNARLPGEPASPLDSYYVINGEQVMMKIPKPYADVRYASQKKLCDAAVAATEPPPTVEKNEGTVNAKLREDRLADIETDHRVFNKSGFREI